MALAMAELPEEAAASVLIALGTFAPAAAFARPLVQRHNAALLAVLLAPLTRYAPAPRSLYHELLRVSKSHLGMPASEANGVYSGDAGGAMQVVALLRPIYQVSYMTLQGANLPRHFSQARATPAEGPRRRESQARGAACVDSTAAVSACLPGSGRCTATAECPPPRSSPSQAHR